MRGIGRRVDGWVIGMEMSGLYEDCICIGWIRIMVAFGAKVLCSELGEMAC